LKPPALCYESKAVPVYHPINDAASVRPLVVERMADSLGLHLISQTADQWTRKITCETSWDVGGTG
jgi:hypothetical protein